MSKPIGLVPDEEHRNMWRLVWADGVLSRDFYNLTWAKDNLKNYEEKRDDMRRRRARLSTKKPKD